MSSKGRHVPQQELQGIISELIHVISLYGGIDDALISLQGKTFTPLIQCALRVKIKDKLLSFTDIALVLVTPNWKYNLNGDDDSRIVFDAPIPQEMAVRGLMILGYTNDQIIELNNGFTEFISKFNHELESELRICNNVNLYRVIIGTKKMFLDDLLGNEGSE